MKSVTPHFFFTFDITNPHFFFLHFWHHELIIFQWWNFQKKINVWKFLREHPQDEFYVCVKNNILINLSTCCTTLNCFSHLKIKWCLVLNGYALYVVHVFLCMLIWWSDIKLVTFNYSLVNFFYSSWLLCGKSWVWRTYCQWNGWSLMCKLGSSYPVCSSTSKLWLISQLLFNPQHPVWWKWVFRSALLMFPYY